MSYLCILTGPERGEDGRLHCQCCGEPTTLGGSMGKNCCPCAFGQNPHCVACVERGVPFNKFRGKRAKMHRLVSPVARGEAPRAACGFTVPAAEHGCGTAVIHRYCKRCWPEEQDYCA